MKPTAVCGRLADTLVGRNWAELVLVVTNNETADVVARGD